MVESLVLGEAKVETAFVYALRGTEQVGAADPTQAPTLVDEVGVGFFLWATPVTHLHWEAVVIDGYRHGGAQAVHVVTVAWIDQGQLTTLDEGIQRHPGVSIRNFVEAYRPQLEFADTQDTVRATHVASFFTKSKPE